MLARVRSFDVATAFFVTVARLGAGMRVSAPARRQPAKLLELYEFEACPYCRKVREALTELDLDAIIYPCPRGGTRFRPVAVARSGKKQFPFLVDPNTGKELLESNDIIRYLTATYGDGTIPLQLRLGPLTNTSAVAAAVFRAHRGRAARPSRTPEKLLELWSFEASPYCRLAREALASLEIPYVLHNVGKGSTKRPGFVARSGKMQVPYLVDPNTDTSMFESADIVRYLENTYGA